MLMAYASVAAFFLVAIGFVLGSLVFGKIIRPKHLYAAKLTTYECGEEPIGPAWFNFNPRFYIVALIYIVFDVEIAFIYPVAAVFRRWVDQGSGLFALVEIAMFVAILMVGLVYVWVKRDLEWIHAMRKQPQAASGAARPAPTSEPPSEPSEVDGAVPQGAE
jgi:NADH-quinone oxidoreductase subunit A